MHSSKQHHSAGVVTVDLWNHYHYCRQRAIKCHQEGSLNSHKIALWVSNGDVSVMSGQTFHFTKERCETPGEELCQVTDLAGSRSKTGTQLSHPRVTGAPPPCDGTSPGRPETSGFPLAVHVIYVDAHAHILSLPGCPSCRDGTRWRSALAPPPAPPPLAASPVVNWVVEAPLSLAPRTALTHTSYREPGRRACTEYWLRGGCSRKVVFPPSPPTRPYFRRMKSTLARGGVHSTKATVSETSRTRI